MNRYVPTTFGAVLLAASLSACAATPPKGTPPPDTTPAPVCDASTLGWTVGKTANEALVTRAREESGAKAVRILRPGQVVTMEYSDGRLNLYVDAANKVERAVCG